LDDRRHRNVDAGLRLSASGDPQTGPGRWDLRVRQAGLGDYVGFNSAIGYWASACAGNTSYWVLITATLSAVVPGFGAGDTVLAVVVSAIGVWLFVFLVLRGVKDAAVINYIVTVAKVVPILVFIVIAIIAFKGKVFADNFWGGGADYSFSSVWDQATGTMLITVFVFLGIEGASVYSRMARNREDVGRATVIGFLSVLSVFAMVTLMSYGVMRLRANWPASANPRWRRCWNPLSDHRDRPSSASV
jgi:arginine:ornithine antiporter/lysine permease